MGKSKFAAAVLAALMLVLAFASTAVAVDITTVSTEDDSGLKYMINSTDKNTALLKSDLDMNANNWESLSIKRNILLTLHGHTLSIQTENNAPLFKIEEGKTLTLKNEEDTQLDSYGKNAKNLYTVPALNYGANNENTTQYPPNTINNETGSGAIIGIGDGKKTTPFEVHGILEINGGIIRDFETKVIVIKNRGTVKINGGAIYSNSVEPAIYVESGGTLIINGGIIANNNNGTAGSDKGGAIFCQAGGTVTVNGGYIIHNTAAYGGGICIEGNGANLNINGGYISHNHATRRGGGIYVNEGSTATMNGGNVSYNSVIADNDSEYDLGGGIGVYNSALMVRGDSRIENNRAKDGGGIHAEGSSASVTITNGTIKNNTAQHTGAGSTLADGLGGGVCAIANAALTLNGDASIKENNARLGGGVAVSGAALKMINANIVNNKANQEGASGGGLYIKDTNLAAISGGVISGNKANYGNVLTDENGGGITIEKSTVTVSGGTIKNNESGNGGGVYLTQASTLNISNPALIQNNTAHDSGGGVCAKSASTVNFSGGTIDGNYAEISGGGLLIDNDSYLEMIGGDVTKNTSKQGEGGGLSIKADPSFNTSSALITGGTFTGNKAGYTQDGAAYSDFQHWGGGGIFVSENCYLYMPNKNLLIENTAGGFGGGLAGCSTAHINVYNNTAIYDNAAAPTAEAAHLSGGGSTKNYDHTWAMENEVFRNNGYQDYFCAFNSSVANEMYNGGHANWVGSADGVGVRAATDSDEVLSAVYVMGMTAEEKNPPEVGTQDVLIQGNTSYTHGGGILCNGCLLLGTIDDGASFTVRKSVEIKGSKQYEGGDLSKETFRFELKDGQGNVVLEGSSKADGSVAFNGQLIFDKTNCGELSEGGSKVLTYTLSEVIPDHAQTGVSNESIVYDDTVYELSFTVQKQKVDIKDVPGDVLEGTYLDAYAITVWSVKNLKTNQTLSGSDVQFTDMKNKNKAGVVKINTPFVNEASDALIAFKAQKRWVDNGNLSGIRPQSITIHLLANGVTVETATVTEADGWACAFRHLPKKDNTGKDILYTVTEEPVNGYTASIQGGVITNTQTLNPAHPATGDDSNIALYALTMSVCLALLAALRRRRRA